MQRGCMQRNSRKEGPDVWQFRWSETRLDGTRLYHKKIIGPVAQYPEEDAARRSVVGLVSELNTDGRPTNSTTMTVAQLCDHFEQHELAKENSWRSHATKKIYKAYLTRWIRPHWKKYQLAEVRTIQVESWLRGLPLATAPDILTSNEVQGLLANLRFRERTLVVLAVTTGLRRSEIFALKWKDVDFHAKQICVTRSIVQNVVGVCKTESSQKPVPAHYDLLQVLREWHRQTPYQSPESWVFASPVNQGRWPYLA